MAEHLLLKWGTLKGWGLEGDRSQELLKDYFECGVSMSAMMQRDTPGQQEILCDLIDAIDGEIMNDWSGDTMSKDEAKKYVREYQAS